MQDKLAVIGEPRLPISFRIHADDAAPFVGAGSAQPDVRFEHDLEAEPMRFSDGVHDVRVMRVVAIEHGGVADPRLVRERIQGDSLGMQLLPDMLKRQQRASREQVVAVVVEVGVRDSFLPDGRLCFPCRTMSRASNLTQSNLLLRVH